MKIELFANFRHHLSMYREYVLALPKKKTVPLATNGGNILTDGRVFISYGKAKRSTLRRASEASGEARAFADFSKRNK